MVQRRLRPGMDRHALGDEVAGLLLSAEDVPTAFTGEGPVGEVLHRGERIAHAVQDPFGNGRMITGQGSMGFDKRLIQATLRFRSTDKMDIDSAYQALRKRLRRHGSPSRDQSQRLVFSWRTPQGVISLSRYRDDEDMAVLHIVLKGSSSGA